MPPLVTGNAYLALQTNSQSNINYTWHENFTDQSTLQYQPVVAQYVNYFNENNARFLGTGNGYAINSAIDDYLIKFFDMYIKNKVNNHFQTCTPLENYSLIFCGNS